MHMNKKGNTKHSASWALVEAMQYQYDDRQILAVDNLHVLPIDWLNAELFCPQWLENAETNETVQFMACEVADWIFKELHYTNKATSDHLLSINGKVSWGQTTDDEHVECIGKMTTNDWADSQFASLPLSNNCLRVHASAIGKARINGDFVCDFHNNINDGVYHSLSLQVQQTLMLISLDVATAVQMAEKTWKNIFGQTARCEEE